MTPRLPLPRSQRAREAWLEAHGAQAAPSGSSQWLTVVCDTREQRPFAFNPSRVVTIRGALPTGDYAPEGHEDRCAIERKSLDDLVQCCTWERARFERELERLAALPCGAVVVEASLGDLLAGNYRSRANPRAVLASVAAWSVRHVPVFFAGGRREAAALTEYLLRAWVRDHGPDATEPARSGEAEGVAP